MTSSAYDGIWKHPDIIASAPSIVHACRNEAERLLLSNTTVTPEAARAGQLEARRLGDDIALAFWSRLRVRALRHAGSKELLDWT